MVRIRIVWFFLFLLVLPLPAQAQTGDRLEQIFRFAHLTAVDGLADNRIEVIFQDSRGFIWLGTHNGLSRYDGYTFLTYRPEPDNLNSLSGNSVVDIIEDERGRLWIANGRAGLTIFEPGLDRFTRLKETPGVHALFQDSRGLIWAANLRGDLLKIEPTTLTVKSFSLDDDKPYGIWDITADEEGRLWLAASSSLVRFEPETEQFTYHTPDEGAGEIRTVYADADGFIWGDGNKLHKFDPATETFTAFSLPDDTPSIVRFIVDRHQMIWLATPNGLFRFDPRTEQFVDHFTRHPANPEGLNSNRLFSLFEDEAGLIWIGTENAGLNIYDPRQTQFAAYRFSGDDLNPIAVTSLAGDGSGTLWVGTETGLRRVDLATDQVEPYSPPEVIGPNPLGVSALHINEEGQLWFGWANQLLHFEPNAGRFTAYPLSQSESPEPPNPITDIYEDEAGILWLARQREGFFRFDPQTETLQSSLPPDSKQLQAIYGESSTGEIGLVSPHSLMLFNPQTGQFIAQGELPFDEIHDVYEQNGFLWVAAANGLFQLKMPTAEVIAHYTDQDGLPSSPVMAILADRSGYLWLSSRQGLCRFDPQSPKNCRHFDETNGVAGDLFGGGTAWAGPDGRLYFGGEKGLTAFYPDRVSQNAYQPPVILTGLSLFHKPVPIGENPLLPQAIWQIDQLRFTHRQNILTFEFSALSYAAPHKNRYRYQLDGFDDDWHEGGGDHRYATYTNLPPGTYTFRAQGSNSDGLWSNDEISLPVIVVPPWWGTAWFRSLVLVGLIGLVYSGYRWRVYAIQQRNRQLEQEVTDRTQELRERTEQLALSNAQTGTMAHLFRQLISSTSLEQISALVLEAAKELTGSQFGYVGYIDNQTGHLVCPTMTRDIWQSCQVPNKSIVFEQFGGLWGWTLQNRKPLLTNTPADDPRSGGGPPAGHLPIRRFLSAPALVGDTLLGQVALANSAQDYTAADLDLVERLAAVYALAVQRRRMESALELSEERFATVMNSLEALMYVADMQTYELLFVNEYTRRLFGDVVGKVCWQVLQAGQDRPCDFCTNGFLIKDGEPAGIHTWEFQNTITGRWYYIQDRAIRWVDDRLVRMEVATDITDLKEAEEALREAKRVAEAANRAKSAFLANMSHELRTPLNAILGYTQLWQNGSRLSPAPKNEVAAVERSGKHLLALINDILDLSKIEAGHLELCPTEFYLPALLDDIQQMFQLRARQKRIWFQYEPLTLLPTEVIGDEKYLRQILINLLGNAIKFTQEGGITFQTEVIGEIASPPARIVRFTITDTGPGISAEALELIFEPFRQGQTHPWQIEGTGLGLAISQRLAQLMGSAIQVESVPAQGSRFWLEITLPLTDRPLSAVSESDRKITGYQGPAYNTLVVDDDPLNRAILGKALRSLGFTVYEAVDGTDGLAKATEHQPQVILVDWYMPRMDGLGLTRQLRQKADFEDTIIISISASAFEEDRQTCLAVGCDDFLAKPIRLPALLSLLQKYLDLEWIYEEQPSQQTPAEARLLPPPPELFTRLYEATRRGDIYDIRTMVEEIEQIGPEHQPFANRVRQLAEQYQISALNQFVSQYQNKEP